MWGGVSRGGLNHLHNSKCVLHTCSCSVAGVLVPGRGCPRDQPLINSLSTCLPGAPCWWIKCTLCDLARRVPGSLSGVPRPPPRPCFWRCWSPWAFPCKSWQL